LVVPDIINYDDNVCATFTGAGAGLLYDEVHIGLYYEYLEERGVSVAGITIETLRKHALVLTDEDGRGRDRFGLYKALIFDVNVHNVLYHFSDGAWYKVDPGYLKKLTDYVDAAWVPAVLPDYTNETEGEYNEAVGNTRPMTICLDRSDISPSGETADRAMRLVFARSGPGCASPRESVYSVLSAKPPFQSGEQRC